jgi:acetylornithine/N-succinyldiaminopimelate aminotransferase
MGAVLLKETIASALAPGDHATTFGGGPLVASVALDVVRALAHPDLLASVRRNGEWLETRLSGIAGRSQRVRAVRGRGLMWGVELAEPAAPLVAAAREQGLLSRPRARTSRIPPLVITPEISRGHCILEGVLA